MKLSCKDNQSEYEFVKIALKFDGTPYQNIFSQKNNKSVAETLEHPRYSKLKNEVVGNYPEVLDKPLGAFLFGLKKAEDAFYKRFLNKYGDLVYSNFGITDSAYFNSKGIYTYLSGDALKYIGRCRDSMKKRVNHGYGRIHPKNCYLDGQATNCHLNARITAEKSSVTLWLHQMESEHEIETLERELIRAYNPPWNVQRG